MKEQLDKLSKETYILLVEDDPDHVELALRALERHGVANRIVVARDGAEAVECLFGSRYASLPEVVLLDLKLPRISGLGYCAEFGRARSPNFCRLLSLPLRTKRETWFEVMNWE